jgi:polysaccharide biosynthesis/export protein
MNFGHLIFPFLCVILSLANPLFAQTFGRMNPEPEQIPTISSISEFQEDMIALEKPIDPDQYIIGPGDELAINVAIRDNLTWILKVTPTGHILIPTVGILKLSGMTLSEAQVQIKTFINTKTYPQAPVNVVLNNMRNFRILITGAVIKPGYKTVSPVTRLENVISMAGGFHQLAKEFDIHITGENNKAIVVNYLNYLRNGDENQNPLFLEGDKIYVPFADIGTESIVLRGAITGGGYDIIEKDESLESFLQRRASFGSNADLQNITITRTIEDKNAIITVLPKDFASVTLKPGYVIDVISERGVMVNGYVQTPGGYVFFPGYDASNYINLAGGNTSSGNPNKAIIYRLDGTVLYGQETEIQRGDIIVVPLSRKYVFFGDDSILSIAASTLTILLTFLAVSK